MNPSVIFICLVLAFVAFTETDAVRGGWASGADKDRDPANPNYRQGGQQNAKPYMEEGQNANARADGNNLHVGTYTGQKGTNKVSEAWASGSNYASSSARAK